LFLRQQNYVKSRAEQNKLVYFYAEMEKFRRSQCYVKSREIPKESLLFSLKFRCFDVVKTLLWHLQTFVSRPADQYQQLSMRPNCAKKTSILPHDYSLLWKRLCRFVSSVCSPRAKGIKKKKNNIHHRGHAA